MLDTPGETDAVAIRSALARRSIVLVGMMGAGKSTIGRRLGLRLALPFLDADREIETAAGLSVAEIFERHGEAYFRDGERRVIARLLEGGPCVLATGGGAYMVPETRAGIAANGVSVWLRAELATLMSRVRKRSNRPLLRTPDPEGTLRALMAAREPTYALADLTVHSRDAPHETIVTETVRCLRAHLDPRRAQ